MQQWNLLAPRTKVTVYRRQSELFFNLFSKDEGIFYCNDILELIHTLVENYDPNDSRLFIDSFKKSIETVLLHIRNILPFVPVAYSTTMKKTFQNLQFMLEKIRYSEHNWLICADLKVIAILTGLQLGYTKYCCFSCLWDSGARSENYVRKQWSPRLVSHPGQHNIANIFLVPQEKIILSPLYIKLGLFKLHIKLGLFTLNSLSKHLTKNHQCFNSCKKFFQICLKQKSRRAYLLDRKYKNLF